MKPKYKAQQKHHKNSLVIIAMVLGMVIGSASIVFAMAPAEGQPVTVASIEVLTAELEGLEGRAKVDRLNLLVEKWLERDRTIAVGYIDQALTLAESIGYQEGVLAGKLHLVYLAIIEEQYAKAITDLDGLVTVLTPLDNPILMAKAKNAYGQLWLGLSDFQRAQDAFDSALSLFKSAGDSRGVAQAKLNLGVVYALVGGFDKAVSHYLEAIDTFEALGQIEELADAYSNLGSVNAQMGRQEDAITYYTLALETFERVNDRRGVATAYNNLGAFFLELALTEQAGEFFDQAQKIYTDLNDQTGIGDVALHRGALLEGEKDLEGALKAYQAADVAYQSVGYLEGQTVAKNNMGTVYYLQGAYQEALEAHQAALDLAQEMTYKEGLLSALKNLSMDYQALGNLQKANEMMATYLELNDYLLQESIQAQTQNKQVLHETEKKERALVAEQAAKALVEAQRRRLMVIVGIISVAGLVISGLLVLVAKERRKSEKLLLNILPKKIADKLKKYGKAESERFENVTVYFSDVVNFTTTSATLEPEFLIGELNAIFTLFDNIMESHGCERIKTIGDAYLAVCGMPVAREDHAKRMVSAALEIREALAARNSASAVKWEIRIGIHTGSVVGGIVGIKKYIYDVFGDTINTASRMESNSEPMHVNISETTFAHVAGNFQTIKRDMLTVKGKGNMQMYFVR